MSYSNHYKSQVGDTAKKKNPKKQKKEGNPLPFSISFDPLSGFLKDDRTRNILGVFLLILSGVLLLSMTSYLFTWKIDQDHIIDSTFRDVATNPDMEIENWLGTIGAFLGHTLIFKGFGIASLAFVLISFLAGIKILFRVDILPFWKTVGYSIFSMIWTSLVLGVLFNTSSLLFLSGRMGYFMNYWLSGVMGTVGAISVILFSALVFAVVNFNFRISNLFKSDLETDTIDESLEQNEVLEDQDIEEINEPETEVLNSVSFDEDNSEASSPEEVSDESDGLDLELETESNTIDEPVVADSGMTMEVEAPTETTIAIEEETTNTEGSEGELSLDVEDPVGDDEITDTEKLNPDEMVDYDPLLDLSKYKHPPIELLADHGDGSIQVEREELELNKNRIVDTLKNYNIGISKIKATIGPTVTLYEIVPEAGVRISKIKNLEDDIALSLAALGIRIIAPIPGKGTIGIEVPNQTPDVVSMRTVIKSEKFQHAKMELPIALGKTINNETFVVDLAKMPHLLMAGATGQGKSVGLNAILASLLYKKHPAQVKFILVDPKKVELTLFNKIERHFLAKLPDEEEAIITDTSKVVATLNSLCIEMDDRYEMLKNAQCRNIKEYNTKFIKRKLNPNNGHKYLPYIVLVVDEFADLIMTAGKEVELPIARLAQLARAIGIHLIIATQRPSVNIITGTIKANFPSRIAFRVTSKIDSRTILDTGGAEQLIGRGDMLYSNGNDLIRLQCAFVDTPEVEEITNFIGAQQGYPDAHLLPEYVGEGGESGGDSFQDMDRDALFEDAARVIVLHQQGSASLLQRKLKLGYNRAGRIVDQLEAAGIIGQFEGSKARQVLIADEVSLERHLESLNN